MSTVFDIEQKQDSAERLLAVADKEPRYILFADEENIPCFHFLLNDKNMY